MENYSSSLPTSMRRCQTAKKWATGKQPISFSGKLVRHVNKDKLAKHCNGRHEPFGRIQIMQMPDVCSAIAA